ncbi:HNH endonuclease [Lichenicola cladoniae]|uniref:Putative HNH nuclease YajD n=1 Tax=Lichenicola cladoniae TaxID=1484109 RepID=A0A6M8HVT9_9PROT|nr:HNH endonuclease [Acetobacteraceae bacterium]QKE92492.1 HNH endonuclease [Lichenicola cladoniae]
MQPGVVYGAERVQQFDQRRGSASSRGYDRAWQRCRNAFIASYPLCLFCLNKGIVQAAEEVDHIKSIEAAPELRLDWSNLRSLCKACHSSRTATDTAATRRHEPCA